MLHSCTVAPIVDALKLLPIVNVVAEVGSYHCIARQPRYYVSKRKLCFSSRFLLLFIFGGCPNNLTYSPVSHSSTQLTKYTFRRVCLGGTTRNKHTTNVSSCHNFELQAKADEWMNVTPKEEVLQSELDRLREAFDNCTTQLDS